MKINWSTRIKNILGIFLSFAVMLSMGSCGSSPSQKAATKYSEWNFLNTLGINKFIAVESGAIDFETMSFYLRDGDSCLSTVDFSEISYDILNVGFGIGKYSIQYHTEDGTSTENVISKITDLEIGFGKAVSITQKSPETLILEYYHDGNMKLNNITTVNGGFYLDVEFDSDDYILLPYDLINLVSATYNMAASNHRQAFLFEYKNGSFKQNTADLNGYSGSSVKVAFDYNNDPYSYGDENSMLGFEGELVSLIAAHIGVEVKGVDCNGSSDIFDKIRKGSADIGLSMISSLPENEQLIYLSDCYYSIDEINVYIAVRKGKPALLKAINEAIAELKSNGEIDRLAEKYMIEEYYEEYEFN